MNRLYILLTVMVVMVGALFTGQEAWLRSSSAPTARIRSWGPKGTTASTVAPGTIASTVSAATTRSKVAPATAKSSRRGRRRRIRRRRRRPYLRPRHPRGGFHRLWRWLRPGRDYTSRRQDQEKLRESPRP